MNNVHITTNCTYVCIYIYIHIHTHICIHTHLYIYIYIERERYRYIQYSYTHIHVMCNETSVQTSTELDCAGSCCAAGRSSCLCCLSDGFAIAFTSRVVSDNIIIMIIHIITRIKHTWMAHRCMCLSVNDRTGEGRRVGVSTRCALSRVLLAYSTRIWLLGANLAAPMTGRNEKPNQTGRTEPNRTEPNRLIPEPAGTGRGTEPNRTEPDRATACPKNASRTASNWEKHISEKNRTDPNR